ncbi:hypothetical protein D1007_19943 [Hordeum vulgare]|nr:hypothetical protein D1007_19943 [Hordeum vulgare]
MEADPSFPSIRNEIWHEGNFRTAVPRSPLLGSHCPATVRSGPSSSPFFAATESHVNVEVAHAQIPPADLVAGHVAPAVTQGTNAPARKRQGNVVVQGSNSAGPVGKARAPGAAVAARSARPPAEKMSKASGVKRKKVPTKRTKLPNNDTKTWINYGILGICSKTTTTES